MSSKHRNLFLIFLLVAFLFRLWFGLCSEFWSSDEKHTYLTGLKFYTTGEWPFYGPYVNDWIQIPGALEGLVIGLPLFLLPIPEAPFILLNIISFASLCFFAWYCTKRLPEIPAWFVWPWLMIAPWTLNFSTHIVNPSYLLPGSLLFFVAAIESCPPLSRKLIRRHWANLLMGVSLFWVMQFHMSWVVLVPFALTSFYFQLQSQGRKVLNSLLFFALGSMISGVFLLPTFWRYGFVEGLGGIDSTVEINPTNLWRHLNIVEGVLGRFLSFASFELPRFIGRNTQERLAFFKAQPLLIPFGLFLFILGIAQPIALIVMWFSSSHCQSDWKLVKYLTLGTVLLLYVLFIFTFKEPGSHTYYVTFPIAMLYSLYCWDKLLQRFRWRTFAKVFIISGVIFQAGLAVHRYSRISLYLDRGIPRAAIAEKNYRVLGERRVGGKY